MLTLAALVGSVRDGRNVPLGDDWQLVPAVTGHERDMPAWLWQQTGDDREPLPRMILVAAIAATRDFRAGAVIATLLMSALAAGMILTASALRGGRARFGDLFLPLLLLHPGHWTGLGSAHTVAGAVAAVLTSVLLLAVLFDPALCTQRWQLASVAALVLLPLTGTASLLLALVMAPWIAHCGWRHWPPRYVTVPPTTGPGLLGYVTVMLLVIGLYFAGYDQTPWTFPEPDPVATLRGTMLVFASAAGPAATDSSRFSLPVIGVIVLGTCVMLITAILRLEEDARERARGLASFVAAFAVVALLIGWRAAGEPSSAASPVWALLATPAACAAFFIWELYAPSVATAVVQLTLLAALGAFVPGDLRAATSWRTRYHAGVVALERDIAAGRPVGVLAASHNRFLRIADTPALASWMTLLEAAKFGSFGTRARPASAGAEARGGE